MSLRSAVSTWLRMSADFVSDLRHPTAWLKDAWVPRVSAGVAVTPQTSMSLAAYYACMRNISEDIGKLPLMVYERLTRGKERAMAHPLWHLLHDAPNDDMTTMTWREVSTHHLLGWGNAYSLIERDVTFSGRGQVVALTPVHPSNVTIRRDDRTGQLVYDLKLRSGPERIRAYDMLHIKGLGCDGIKGYSVLQFAAQSIGVGLAAQEYGASFFGNSSLPTGIIKHKGQISKDKERLERFREQWDAGRNGTRILEDGMEWEQVSIPPEQAQFLETRKFQVQEVCRWFRMPPHKIQDLDNAHFTNIEEQNLEYVTDTLLPWLVRWEQSMKQKLFTETDTDYFAEHLVTGLLRGDMAKRAAFMKELFSMAALSPNDIREIENMNPVDNGDIYFVAANNYRPLDQAIKAPLPTFPPSPNGAARAQENGHAHSYAS